MSSYCLKKLQTRHREVARLVHQGWTNNDIAAHMGIDPKTVNAICRDPLFKNHLASLEDKADKETVSARKVLAEGAVKAAERVVELIDAWDEKVALTASKDVLDRTGHAPKTQNLHAHLHLTGEDVARLKERAKQIGVVVPDDETPPERDLIAEVMSKDE